MSGAHRRNHAARGRRRRARRLAAAALVGATLSGASAAQADTVRGTRSRELVERGHEILVTVDRGHATLRVRRALFNGGPRHDQAVLKIDVPEHAVATGLRTRGELRGRPTWFDGKLLEAELAAERYRELTGIGGYYPKDPALLSWRSQELLALQVFPVAPGTEKQVEYTFTLPARYEGGRYHVHLPQLGTDARVATYTLLPAHARDQLFVDDTPVVPGKKMTPGAEGITLALGRHDAPWIEGRLGVARAGERAVMHFALDGAREFSAIPDGAHVVVVIDASRSRDVEALEASHVAARAYLESFRRAARAPGSERPRRGARVELLSFDRTVHRHTRGFESTEKALARLEGLGDHRGNGSAMDDALAEAGRLLARAPRGAARRVLVISDLELRDGLEAPRLAELARRTGAIVHVSQIMRGGDAALLRFDDDDWDRVPRATGGLLWRASVDGSARAIDDELRDVFEEWARPRRLDHVTLTAEGGPALRHPQSFAEGDGYARFEITDAPVRHVRLTAELWSEPVREVFTPSRAEGDLWSALVFGDDLHEELSEAEMMPLARRGGAVSPVTSYLAIEPGVRPSTEGLDWGQGVGIGLGGRGRRVSRVHQARAKVAGAPPDRVGWLKEQLEKAWSACGGAQRAGAVTLASTWREVVDVSRVEVRGAPEPVLQSCVLEAAWALELPEMFSQPRGAWDIPIG